MMTFQQALNTLQKKHLLIIGGTATQRQQMIDELINQANFECFRFPINMRTIDDYVGFVRKAQLYRPWYEKKGKYGLNQVLDFHRDWIRENNALVVMEEFQQMEEIWKLDLLQTYLAEVENRKKGQKIIHLIISQPHEAGLVDKLCEVIRLKENEKRTERQVVEGSLSIFEMV